MGYRIHINLKEQLNTKKVDVPGTCWFKNLYWNEELFNKMNRKQVKRDLDHDEMGFDTDDAYIYDYNDWILEAKKIIKNGYEYSWCILEILDMIETTIKEQNIKPKYIIVAEW